MSSPYSVALSAGMGLALTLWMTTAGTAQTTGHVDLTEASLQDLMKIQVTSVSKKKQPLSKTGSAIQVISQEDIRHSGARNIPDLLRMVPGVDVARINANSWAISIRGFNARYSGLVLVVIDGRSVYTPLFSGVYWDQQGVPLEQIERIEVIRGPGGTVWGANAVNGVINIITKNAEDTRGGLIAAAAGSEDRAEGLVQYGGSAGTKGSYRVYGRYFTNSDSPSLPGRPARDNGHSSRAGFRSDWVLSPHDKLTVQGSMSGNSESDTVTTLFSNRLPDYYTLNDNVRVGAANVSGRWDHVFYNGSETSLQIYYDRYRRFDQGLNVLNTGDADFQYHFRAGVRNDIVTGIDYRLNDQSFANGYALTIGSGHRRDNYFAGFIQDELQLTDSLALTMGIKVEHNSYTGIEYEPSAQIVYSPTSRQTIWASASRAIQQPSWTYAEAQVDQAAVPVPGAGIAIYHIAGNPHPEATSLLDYEVGYRAELSRRLTVDTDVFISDYHRLQTLDPLTPYFTLTPAPPHLVLPNVFGNLGDAMSRGIEASAHWDATKWWRISPGYSYYHVRLSLPPGSRDASYATSAPKQQAQLRSNIKLPHNVEWDTSAYYVGALALGSVPAYTRLDTRIGWHIGESMDAGITGQNLLSPGHVEFMDGLAGVPTLAPRAVVANITFRF